MIELRRLFVYVKMVLRHNVRINKKNEEDEKNTQWPLWQRLTG